MEFFYGYILQSETTPESFYVGFTEDLGFDFAVKSLQDNFTDPGQEGPIRAAESHSGNATNLDRIREEVATVGEMLLGI